MAPRLKKGVVLSATCLQVIQTPRSLTGERGVLITETIFYEPANLYCIKETLNVYAIIFIIPQKVTRTNKPISP